MKRINLVVLSILVGFVFIILAIPGFAQEEQMEQKKEQIQQQMEQQKEQMMQKKGEMMQKVGKMQTIEGKVLCVEADQQGHVTAVEKPECNGVSVVVGKSGKLYTLYGAEGKMKEMAMEGKVSGEVEGSQRAWIIYAGGLRPTEKPEEETVSGTVFCLLPNYQNGTVTPVIATQPCINLPPHAHVMATKDGKLYAIEGSQEAIHKMETTHAEGGMNVTIKGKLQGHEGAWILFVD